MRIHAGLGFSVLATALLASTAAFADPVQNIGGVLVPLGPIQISETDYESQITALSGPGSNFEGFGVVSQIASQVDGTTTYFGGNNPAPYLYDEFSGFTIDTADSTTSTIYLKGGQLDYYTFATNQTPTLLSDSPDAAVAAVQAGTAFLTLTPQVINAAGDTLEISIPSGNLSNVANSSAYAYLDVNPTGLQGSANPDFTTCTIPDSDATGAGCPVGVTDFSVNDGANANANTNFPVSGTGDVKAVAVPEPLTISLFGAGLMGAAAMRRRKKKA